MEKFKDIRVNNKIQLTRKEAIAYALGNTLETNMNVIYEWDITDILEGLLNEIFLLKTGKKYSDPSYTNEDKWKIEFVNSFKSFLSEWGFEEE